MLSHFLFKKDQNENEWVAVNVIRLGERTFLLPYMKHPSLLLLTLPLFAETLYADPTRIWNATKLDVNTFRLAKGDVDGDGDTDVIATGTLLLNDGSGIMEISTAGDAFPSFVNGILADFDGDDDLDFLSKDSGATASLFKNNGSGVFTKDPVEIPWVSRSTHAVEADVDGDDDLDVLITGGEFTDSLLLLNDGSGGFTESASNVGTNFRSSAFFDVENDGDLDIFAVGNGSSRLFLNDGSGDFTVTDEIYRTGSSRDVAVGDLNGDDHDDLYILAGSNNASSSQDFVYFGDGAGGLTQSTESWTTEYTFGVALADVDDDGDLDAFTGGNNNIPNSNFTRFASNQFGQTFAGRPLIDDFNGDGKVDLFPASSSGESRIFLNQQEGETLVFAPTAQRFGGNEATSGAQADFDGDNDLDVIIAGRPGDLRLFKNDGDGNFIDTGDFATGLSGWRPSMATGDLDGDGDQDLLVGYEISAPGNAAATPLRRISGPDYQ